MSYDKLLSDRANIYHLDKTSSGGGFGLPSEDAFSYPSTPDLTNVPCYLVRGRGTLIQTDSMHVSSSDDMAHFKYATDLREGDKVVIDGSIYKAGKPYKVKQHHIECPLRRENAL
ncbi:DUF3599 family protein [Exiguobacterium artemiae]